MQTYQIRKRIYRVDDPNGFEFPNELEIVFELRPLQAFGMEAGNGRTAVQHTEASAIFDANTGWHSIESKHPLKPLEVTIEEAAVRKVEIRGNILKVTTRAKSWKNSTIYFSRSLLATQSCSVLSLEIQWLLHGFMAKWAESHFDGN